MSVASVPTSCVLNSSCESCRASKVKCSGELTCARCASKGIHCLYQARKKRGKPKDCCNEGSAFRYVGSSMCQSQTPINLSQISSGNTTTGNECDSPLSASGTTNGHMNMGFPFYTGNCGTGNGHGRFSNFGNNDFKCHEVATFCALNKFPDEFVTKLVESGVTSFKLAAEITEDELKERFGSLPYDKMLLWRSQLRPYLVGTPTSSHSNTHSVPLPTAVGKIGSGMGPISPEQWQCAKILGGLSRDGDSRASVSGQSFASATACARQTAESHLKASNGALSSNEPQLNGLLNSICNNLSGFNSYLPMWNNQPQNNNQQLKNQFYSADKGPPLPDIGQMSLNQTPNPKVTAMETDENCPLQNLIGKFCSKKRKAGIAPLPFLNSGQNELEKPSAAKPTAVKTEQNIGESAFSLQANLSLEQRVLYVKLKMNLVDWLVTLLERLSKLGSADDSTSNLDSQGLSVVLQDIVARIEVLSAKDEISSIEKKVQQGPINENEVTAAICELKYKTLMLLDQHLDLLKKKLTPPSQGCTMKQS